MRVCVIGNGGREHALADVLGRSAGVVVTRGTGYPDRLAGESIPLSARRMDEGGRAHRAGRYRREADDARRRAALVREAIAHLSQAESESADADG